MALVAAFAILPMLWFFILKENRNGKYEWRSIKKVSVELIFLALPVALAIIVQLYMNYARFDSIFEFGTTYQLTVSDVSKNKLRLGDLGYAIYHYFLQPLSFTKDFPLASLFYSALDDYGHFVYVDTGMGLLAIPFMWMLAASIFIFADKKKSLGLKAALGSALFGLVFVAWLDFCLGGVIFRYTCDLTVVGALTSLAVAFALAGDEQSNGDTLALAKGMKAILVFVALASVYVSITLAFSGNVNLTPYSDEVRRVFRALFFK
jgi:hypothetical protein